MHWFCDTFFEQDTPLIGPTFIRPFREHHSDPLSITRHGFLELNGNSCVAVTPFVAALQLVDPSQGALSFALFGTALALLGAGATTNQLHRLAHDPQPTPLARLLQRTHLILTPGHHQVHHTPPFEGHYCVTSGWANAALERIGFWSVAERVLVAVGVPRSRAA